MNFLRDTGAFTCHVFFWHGRARVDVAAVSAAALAAQGNSAFVPVLQYRCQCGNPELRNDIVP
jgi:hypothetical protein